jgi:hypothetical protein
MARENTRSNISMGGINMSPTVKTLVGQAVVQYLDGDIEKFNKWLKQALEIHQRQTRLHATIREILEAKGVHYEAN